MTYDRNNIFAKILRHELSCNKVYEDEFTLAFHDMYPTAPIHVLVIPKGPYKSFDDLCTNANDQFITGFFRGVNTTLHTLELLDKSGYRLITNCGPDADQTVHHFHMHILAGKKL